MQASEQPNAQHDLVIVGLHTCAQCLCHTFQLNAALMTLREAPALERGMASLE